MTRTFLHLAAASLVVFAASGAHAQGYVGVAAAATHYNADCAGTTSCDNSGTGGKVYGGYKFGTSGLALEGFYADFGKARAVVQFGTTNVSASLKGTSLGAALAYHAPLGESFTFSGRLGVASNKMKISGTTTGLSFSDDESKANAYVGLSLGYKVSKNVSIDAHVDSTRFEYDGEGMNARQLGLGVTFSF